MIGLIKFISTCFADGGTHTKDNTCPIFKPLSDYNRCSFCFLPQEAVHDVSFHANMSHRKGKDKEVAEDPNQDSEEDEEAQQVKTTCTRSSSQKDRQYVLILVFLRSFSLRTTFFRNDLFKNMDKKSDRWISLRNDDIKTEDVASYFQWLNRVSPTRNGTFNMDHVIEFMYRTQVPRNLKHNERMSK